MARFRLSRLAQADLEHVLAASAERWGSDRWRRYAAILAATMRKVSADPKGPATRTRAELASGLRSFHIQHARAGDSGAKVIRPVHILYYRAGAPDLIEIVRVLHERMDPHRHLDEVSEDQD